ncbi:hypothetical protein [Streptomyces sp. LaPpAH-108]|uniref:hypothetical protein n=1 Tax=Streptomyces sp. LaPpAH-108 TaxID=1155714 RepID=UPI000477C74A|nr:hypothetical protein [Streptomyces sp. LaPpAH-108]
MPDVWIGLSAAARRRNWWRTGAVALIAAGGTVAVGLAERGPERWWWTGGVGVFGLVAVFDMVDRTYGRALVSGTGIEFRTFVSRRSIPWSEVAGVEKRARTVRSGTWWYLRVVRVRGRSLMVPGTFTNRWEDVELERKLVAVRERWGRAGGGGGPAPGAG